MKGKTCIITGATGGIGLEAAARLGLLGARLMLVGRSRDKGEAALAQLRARVPSVAVEMHYADLSRSDDIVRLARDLLGTAPRIDVLLNNAGAFLVKPFMDYKTEDFRSLVSTNLEGFFFITQMAVKQMLSQGTGGSVTSLTASPAQHPIAGLPASISMLTKGGLNAITISLASEYAKNNIRFNAVAPGAVDTPIVKDIPKEFLMTLSPMGAISDAKDIADAVIYLTEARHITGEVLHVDGGMHVGKW